LAARARQEAEAGAFAALYQRLAELQLTPDVHVRDFLAEEADLRAFAWQALCRGVQVAPPQTYSDGAVTLQVQLPLAEVIARLAEVCQAHYHGAKFRPADFERILLYSDREALWGFAESRSHRGPPLAIADAAPIGWEDVGVFGRLTARHLAAANAYRQILEQAAALRLTPARRVADFLAADKRIAADLEVFVRAQPVAGEVRYRPQRICEVDVAIDVADLVRELKSLANAYYTGTEFKPETFDGLSLLAGSPAIRVTGVAAADFPQFAAGQDPATQKNLPEEVWTRTAQAALPDEVKDAEQARLLAVRTALAQCREQFRAALLAEPSPEEGPIADWLSKVPALRGDIETLLGNLRTVRVKDLPGTGPDGKERRVEVTAELPLLRLRSLLAYYLPKPKAGAQ
jgi:hypothetical protein